MPGSIDRLIRIWTSAIRENRGAPLRNSSAPYCGSHIRYRLPRRHRGVRSKTTSQFPDDSFAFFAIGLVRETIVTSRTEFTWQAVCIDRHHIWHLIHQPFWRSGRRRAEDDGELALSRKVQELLHPLKPVLSRIWLESVHVTMLPIENSTRSGERKSSVGWCNARKIWLKGIGRVHISPDQRTNCRGNPIRHEIDCATNANDDAVGLVQK
jgi:hypothetical protein